MADMAGSDAINKEIIERKAWHRKSDGIIESLSSYRRGGVAVES